MTRPTAGPGRATSASSAASAWRSPGAAPDRGRRGPSAIWARMTSGIGHGPSF